MLLREVFWSRPQSGIAIRNFCSLSVIWTRICRRSWMCILSWTTMRPRSTRRFVPGLYGNPGIMSTSPPPTPPGSIRSKRGLRASPDRRSAGARFAAPRSSLKRLICSLKNHNRNAQPFMWTATAEPIFEKLEKTNRSVTKEKTSASAGRYHSFSCLGQNSYGLYSSFSSVIRDICSKISSSSSSSFPYAAQSPRRR